MDFKSIREKIGTQTELATILKVKQQTVAMWELGLSYPRRPTLKKLSNILDVNESTILNAIDNSKSK